MKRLIHKIYRGLAFRIVAGVLAFISVICGGLLWFFFTVASDFINTNIANDMTQFSRGIYNIGDRSITKLMQTGKSDNPVAVRITKAKTIAVLEDYMRENNLQCFIEDDRETLLTPKSFPAANTWSRQFSEHVRHTYKYKQKEYYIFKFHFDPWNWTIVLIKDAVDYAHLLDRVKQVCFLGALILLPASLLLLLFMRYNIGKPVKSIIRSLQENKPPSYSGIREFEFLSRHFADMMSVLQEKHQAAEKAARTKSQFLANMSHEIRTPMNGIIGFTEMLANTDLNEDQQDYTQTIKRSGETLLILINDILDFSKIEAGELVFEKIDFDPELLAYDVCDLVRPRLESKPVELICEIDDCLPARVMGDPARFRQVLTNLVGNASKFIEQGEIVTSVAAEEETEDRVLIHVHVRDTGIGISPAQLENIFQSFQQADSSTTRKYGGTGLGLSICRQISQLMGGNVWAESKEGIGSTFHFTAWFQKSETPQAKQFDHKGLDKKRILLVHNNAASLDILTRLLDTFGLQVQALHYQGFIDKQFRKALARTPGPDIGLINIQPSVCDGYAVADAIRKSDKPLCAIPLIAMSPFMKGEARKCQAAGFNGFIAKPVQREKLLQMMLRLVAADNKAQKTEPSLNPIVSQHTIREERKYAVRILLAEDNPINQKLATLMLSKAGYQVDVAQNGREAVEMFTDAPDRFDLIFMDIQMPEMDGLTAAQTIRRLGFNPIPIVAMTAHALKGDRDKCLQAGMNDYITKPINRQVVFDVIDKLVLRREGSPNSI